MQSFIVFGFYAKKHEISYLLNKLKGARQLNCRMSTFKLHKAIFLASFDFVLILNSSVEENLLELQKLLKKI